MKAYVDFGGTPEFKLSGAILLYQGHNTAFATYHLVREGRQDEAPQLGAAQPLTTAFLEQLAGELGHRLPVEILPENVLLRTPEVLVWWSPARARTMFFAEHVEEAQAINGKRFPQPALVFKVAGRELSVRALPENLRPGPGTELKTAPYWNCAESGVCCQGTMRSPEVGTSLDAMEAWERAFFQSRFTHAYGAARLTSSPGGFLALWASLADSAGAFPVEYLTDVRETLQQFVERRDRV